MLADMGKWSLWQLYLPVSSLPLLFLVSLMLPLGLYAAPHTLQSASSDKKLASSVIPSSSKALVVPPPFESSLHLDNDSAVTNILGSHAGISSVRSPFSNSKFEEGLTIEASTVKQLMRSVLRIHVVKVIPDFGKAWTNKGETRSTGSGFPISKRRIITNAHVTTYAHLIRIEVPGSPELFDARIVSMVHEPDLCVLTVDDEKFWENLMPLDLVEEKPNTKDMLNTSTIPNLLDGVYVVGYPTGGDSLSVTQGIVSRVEVGFYSHSSAYLIEIQIDAAINPGNSGGPVVNEKGRVVGVAFQGLTNADSIGYIIPAPVIVHVLEDIERHGKYTGMVSLGILIQTLRNPMLKSYLGMEAPDVDSQLPEGVEKNGIVVTKVENRRIENYLERVQDADINKIGFKEEDVILALDGKNVAEDGSIKFRTVERIAMNYLLIGKYAGDMVSATVLRDRKVVELQIPLEDFKDASHRLALSTKIDGYQSQFRTKNFEEVVVISRILSTKYMKGYNVQNQQITHVNGVKIRNLTHLAKLLGMIDHEGKPVNDVLVKPQSSTPTTGTIRNEDVNAITEIQKVALQLEKILKKAMKTDTTTKVIEAVGVTGNSDAHFRNDGGRDSQTVKPDFVKFGFEGDNFNFVIEKQIALIANQELMRFHKISCPFYLGDEFKA